MLSDILIGSLLILTFAGGYVLAHYHVLRNLWNGVHEDLRWLQSDLVRKIETISRDMSDLARDVERIGQKSTSPSGGDGIVRKG